LFGDPGDPNDPLKGATTGIVTFTGKLKEVEKWIEENRPAIRKAFETTKEVIGDVVTVLGTVAGFLKDHPTLAKAIPASYVGWKTIQGIAAVSTALSAINTMLRLTLPAAAAQSAAGMNAGLKKFLPFALIAGTATAAGWLGTEIANGMDGRDLTWMERFDELKKNLAQAFTSENVKKFFSDAKRSGADFVKNLKSEISTGLSGAWESFTASASSEFDNVKNKITAIPGQVKSSITKMWDDLKSGLNSAVDTVTDYVKDKFLSIFGPDSAIGKILSAIGFGTATAGAAATPSAPGATPSAPGAAPFNPGPMAPGLGWFGGAGDFAARQGLAVPPQGLVPKIKPGRYVTADEFATGDVENLGDLNQGLGDCTSAIQDLVNIIEGKPTEGRALSDGSSFWTGNAEQWAAENGFIATDRPMPGAFQVGFSDSHAQATLPTGEAFNWGSNETAAVRGLDGGQGAWFDGATKHYYKQYGDGGKVLGAGGATSDSIPAMLSNGEHVLTAADVKKMGGQGGVYGFRQALQAGLIPGFAPGGAVDPDVVTDTQNKLADLINQQAVDKAKWDEVMANSESTENDKAAATRALARSQRLLDQMRQDAPLIMSGGTPPDRGPQNRVYDTTDQLDAQLRALKDLEGRDPADVSDSQMIQQQYAVTQAQRERAKAISDIQGSGQSTDYGQEFVRSLGFIPASAGNTGVAGTSSLAGFIGMGNDVVGGLIDTGTTLAQMAVSAAITGAAAAGTFGAGAAAAPAASAAAGYGIQLLGNTAKRLSSYGFQMAGIGADALMEQMSPFGMPRWLG
jgi:ElaB/YqjD/DUF883 family membrane-anchored ribosome-binding protein